MFESDDYDQVLSQIDFPELNIPSTSSKSVKNDTEAHLKKTNIIDFEISENVTNRDNSSKRDEINNVICDKNNQTKKSNNISPNHTKRKILNSYFDHKNKRKFPGPAGLLASNFEQKDDDVYQIELLSQDVDFSQNYLHGNVFDTALWKRLLEDTANLKEINTINVIKHQAVAGNLHRKKAQFVIGVVESIDRSAIDPLITLRDKTGIIKCTLHRDAWTAFSTYFVSEFCAIVLCKPTVLTTGSAFKKHYLNITLSNILLIYSSALFNDAENLPHNYQINCEGDYTIIKMDKSEDISINDSVLDNINYLEDLDSIFSED